MKPAFNPLSALRRFLRSKRGIAAMEFALIGPVMATIWVTTIEVTELMLADRRAETLGSQLSDIIARDTTMDTTKLADLASAIPVLMNGAAASDVKVRITSANVGTDGKGTVVWSYGMNGEGKLTKNNPLTGMPSRIKAPNVPSVIETVVTYTYEPPIGFFLEQNFVLKHTDYRRPRLVDPVPCATCPS